MQTLETVLIQAAISIIPVLAGFIVWWLKNKQQQAELLHGQERNRVAIDDNTRLTQAVGAVALEQAKAHGVTGPGIEEAKRLVKSGGSVVSPPMIPCPPKNYSSNLDRSP